MSAARSEFVEDTVLVLDVSRSMARRDLQPDRFSACKQACIAFTRKKLDLNPQNNIGIVLFSDTARKALFFTNDASVVQDTIAAAHIEGNVSYIGSAIALAIQMHVDMLRQISGKVSRVVIVSDGRFATGTIMNPLEMARLAQGLGIQVDAINTGIEDGERILQQVAAKTGGQYVNIADDNDLAAAIDRLAKPIPEATREYLQSKKPLMSDLAGELVAREAMSAAQSELYDKMGEAQRERCIICFKSECPACKKPFKEDGKYCPNCASPAHLHCAAQWALADKKTDSNVFRCTHCYYLLKVPSELQESQEKDEQARMKEKHLKQEERKREEAREKARPATVFATKVTAQELGPDVLMDSTCPACGEPFEDDDYLYECFNIDCSALYHPSCFEKMVDARGVITCKRCKEVLKKYQGT